jgi:hypothetical protein
MEITMKKWILSSIAVLAMLSMGYLASAEPARVSCSNAYAGTIAASGSAESFRSTLTRNEGYFSVQPVGTFTGTLQIQYQVSNDNGTTWSPAVEIVADATSGTVYPFPAAGVNIFAGAIKLVFNETGTSDQVVITGAHLCIQ